MQLGGMVVHRSVSSSSYAMSRSGRLGSVCLWPAHAVGVEGRSPGILCPDSMWSGGRAGEQDTGFMGTADPSDSLSQL